MYLHMYLYMYIYIYVCIYSGVPMLVTWEKVIIASDSEPIRGFGSRAPNRVKGQSPCRGYGDEVPEKLKYFYTKHRKFCNT